MKNIVKTHFQSDTFFKAILFVFIITLMVSPKAVFAQTHVYVQNNTTLEFKVNTIMPSRQLSKSYWRQTTTKVKPGQRVKVLRFNRDKGITNGKFFIFNTTLTAGKDKLILQQKLRGAFVNSHMWQSVKTSKFNDAWYDDRTTHRATSKLNGVSIKIKYRAYSVVTDDSIEYILEESKSNSPLYSKSPNVFDVLTYNVYMRPTTLYKNGQHIRAKLIPPHLSGYDAIVFQEAFDDKVRNILLRGLKREYPYQSKILGSDGGLEQDGGVIIVSRWPIVTQKQKLFGSVCEGVDCLADKGVLYVSINKKGKTYHLFGTHLEADYGKVTRQQLDIFKRFVGQVNPPKSDPVILAGDFNVNSETRPSTKFNDLLRRLSAGKPKHLGTLYSYECTKNDLIGCKSGRSYYDHVLYSNNYAKPIKAFNKVKLLRSNKEWKEYIFEKAYWDLSDHFPVHGHFEFKKTINANVTSDGRCKVGSSNNKIAGLWRKTNKRVLVKRAYSSNNFNSLWRSLSSKGYHLENFEFSKNLWSGIFKKGEGKYAMWRNYDQSGFNKKWKEMNSKSYRLYDLETYTIGGKRKWAGLFKKGSGKYAMFRNYSTSDFATKRKAMAKSGLKLIDIEVYVSRGKTYWSGVWIAGKDGLLNRNYAYNDFKNLVQNRAKSGYKLIDVETYCVNRQQKWAGIWEKSSERQFISFGSRNKTFINLHNSYSSKGFELIDFNNY